MILAFLSSAVRMSALLALTDEKEECQPSILGMMVSGSGKDEREESSLYTSSGVMPSENAVLIDCFVIFHVEIVSELSGEA